MKDEVAAIEKLPLVWHKCSRFPKDGSKQVHLDMSSGSAFFLMDNEYGWMPIYKDCCTFAHDENFTDIIQTKDVIPVLDVSQIIPDWLDVNKEEETEKLAVKEVEDRTEYNLNLIASFVDHIKEETDFVIPESLIISFFQK
jgi:hypothetical protein